MFRKLWRKWKYVLEPMEPTPADYRKLEQLRNQVIDLKKKARILRGFNMTEEANAKDEKAAEIQKKIRVLQATLRRSAA